jgi:hypothetical protein
MKVVSFSLKPGNNYVGSVDGGPEFLIGKRVSYLDTKGLMNVVGSAPSQKYDRAQFRPTFAFWADFIYPTAMAEGGLFHTLNTYDRARFTFTFLQYAAHVPDGDFVVFFRTLLSLPAAVDYFPDLRVQNGRICRFANGSVTAIESSASTELLMDYLNPSGTEVEDTEIIQAARFVHWAQNDQQHRDVQIRIGVNLFKAQMAVYARWYPMLDGAAPPICTVVADIHHQGRAKAADVLMALKSADPLSALLDIGRTQYPDRIATLSQAIDALTKDGTYGQLKYDASKSAFV